MPDTKKLQGMIGLAKRAGKIAQGTPMVCEAVRTKKAQLVLIATDASENAVKKVSNCCAYYQVACERISFSCDELAHIIGKSGLIAAVAVCDASFAGAIGTILTEPNTK